MSWPSLCSWLPILRRLSLLIFRDRTKQRSHELLSLPLAPPPDFRRRSSVRWPQKRPALAPSWRCPHELLYYFRRLCLDRSPWQRCTGRIARHNQTTSPSIARPPNEKAMESLRANAQAARRELRLLIKGPAASRNKMKIVELDELIDRLKGGDTVSYEEVDHAMRPPAIFMAIPP